MTSLEAVLIAAPSRFSCKATARDRGSLRCRISTMAQRDSFDEFEASSLFCPRCRRATAPRKRLLLVLPSGNKYDYVCSECGTAVGGKTDNDPTDFRRTLRPPPRR